MTDIKPYLDSTYLKTAEQAGLSEQENDKVVENFIAESIRENFKLVMIRPQYVAKARQMVSAAKSNLSVGTVIDFPHGNSSIDAKLAEAEKAIADGADELDFVCDYEAFKRGGVQKVKDEVLACTRLCLSHLKTVKWIIEVAALNNLQIAQLSSLVKNIVMSHFKESEYQMVFVKSSTGFYQTTDGLPNGATVPSIIIMLENASPLPIKAAGGVRTYEEAVEMINLGVKRIGTSAAKAIASGQVSGNTY